MKQIRYVLGFILSTNMQQVILAEKRRPKNYQGEGRPEHMNGFFNGIGGVIKDGETALDTITRKAREEANIATDPGGWVRYAVLVGPGWYCDVFKYVANTREFYSMKTVTDEPVQAVDIPRLRTLNVMPNLMWLVPLAVDRDQVAVTAQYGNSFGNSATGEEFPVVVTQDILDLNPELAKEGVQVGETVYVPVSDLKTATHEQLAISKGLKTEVGGGGLDGEGNSQEFETDSLGKVEGGVLNLQQGGVEGGHAEPKPVTLEEQTNIGQPEEQAPESVKAGKIEHNPAIAKPQSTEAGKRPEAPNTSRKGR